MRHLELIDRELCIMEGEEIVHIFEKSGIPRYEYKYMTDWIQTNFDSKMEISETWEKAKEAWSMIDTDNKSFLWSLNQMELTNASDISQGLLATLAGYQGTPYVKKEFENAIKNVRDLLGE